MGIHGDPHIAAKQVDADALMAPAFLGMRQRVRFELQQRHQASTLAKEFARSLFTLR